MPYFSRSFKKIFQDWMLVIAMTAGACAFFLYRSLPFLHPAGPFLLSLCKDVQPVLLFVMLFLNFCKIEPKQMRVHRWMFWLLLIQGGSFAAISLLLWRAGLSDSLLAAWVIRNAVPIEAVMLCMICPTATACAVVTGKLGGNMAGVVTYTVLVNLMVAVIVPLMVPLAHPQEGMDFMAAFSKIISKVFPLLIMPCLTAWLVRYLLPGVHRFLMKYVRWSFYIWAVALSLAILMSIRAIAHCEQGLSVLVWIAVAAAVTCVLQFWVGKRVGARYGYRITAGQSIGQKNTVFAIWMGYTFLDPVVSVVGGFYSICHNLFNSWQLYCKRKVREQMGPCVGECEEGES